MTKHSDQDLLSNLNTTKTNKVKDNSTDLQISLLEEKLLVERQKIKVGEVVIRKEVETRMIHLPIRREKLVIERIGAVNERLSEVDLGEEKVNGIGISDLESSDTYQAQSSYISPSEAAKLLSKIGDRSDGKSIKVRLEVLTDNEQSQQSYQDICDLHS